MLRPLSVGEIIDASIKLYRGHALTLWKLVAIVVVPTEVLGALILTSAVPSQQDVTAGTVTASTFGTLIAGVLVSFVISILGTILSTAVSAKAVGDIYMGEEPDVGRSLRFVGRRFGSLLWMTVIMLGLTFVLSLGVGFVTVIFSSFAGPFGLLFGVFLNTAVFLFLIVSWSVGVPALLIEGLGGWRALDRSQRLVVRRFFSALGVIVLGGILTIVFRYLLQLALGGIFTFAGDSALATFLTSAIGQTISSLIVFPFLAASITILYFDLRVRQEGFDLELMARGFGPGSALPGAMPPAAAPYATQFAVQTAAMSAPRAPQAPPPPPSWEAPSTPPQAPPPAPPPARPAPTAAPPARPAARPAAPVSRPAPRAPVIPDDDEELVDDFADIPDEDEDEEPSVEAAEPAEQREPEGVDDLADEDDDEDEREMTPLEAAQPPWATAPIKRPVPKRPTPRRPAPAPAPELAEEPDASDEPDGPRGIGDIDLDKPIG